MTVPACTSPTTAPPKDTTGGHAVSSAACAWPMPVIEKVNVPLSLETVSTPPTEPVAVGVKSTGTVSVWPSVSVLGRPSPVVLAANALGAALTPLSLTVPLTVSLTCAVLVCPTVVTGNVVAGAWTSALTGAP